MNVHADSSVDAEDISVTGYINDEEDGYDMSFTKGDSVTMKVKVSGVAASKVTYQWLNSDDEDISGETDSELTITKGVGYESYYCKINIDGADWGYSFYLYASNTLSTSSSASIDGEECSLYSDKIQREGIKKGTKVELKVSAESDYEESKLTYQWQKEVMKKDEDGYEHSDYEDIKGATEPTYAFTKETEEKESYVCEISDGNTSRRESFYLPGKSTLTVTQKIGDEGYTDTEPSGDGENPNFYSTTAGTKLKLAVDVESSAQDPELSYTWYGYDEDGYSSEIATEPSCTVTKKTNQYDTDHGEETFWCEVSDGTTTLTYYFYLELDSTLTVNDTKVILGNKEYSSDQKLPNDIAKGTSATLSVSANTTYNNVKWTYQWQKGVTKEDEDGYKYIDYEDIKGATSVDYSFNTSGVDENYRRVTSDGNETRYSEFTIPGENTISATQEIAGKEYSSTKVDAYGWKDENYYPVLEGDTVKLTVKATSSVEETSLTYEWYDDSGEEILEFDTSEDGTSSSCEITKGYGHETYRCKVSDGSRTNTYYFYLKSESTLTETGISLIIGNKEYDDENLPDEIPAGTSITLSASATTTYTDGELTYQWYKETSYNEETEDFDRTSIPNATKKTYSFKTSGIDERYCCKISDGNDSDALSITVCGENTLTATQKIDGKTYDDDYDSVFLEGKEYILSVEANTTLKNAELSYTWYDDDDDTISDFSASEDGKSSSCTITKGSSEDEIYRCEITDGHRTITCEFYLETEKSLTVTQKIGTNTYDESYYYALVGEKLTLSVDANTSLAGASLDYTWYGYDKYWESFIMDATTSSDGKSSSCAITKGSGYEEYCCEVSDGKQTSSYYFYLKQKDTLTVTQKIGGQAYSMRNLYIAKEGTKLTLSVDATSTLKDASLSYTWYDSDGGKVLNVKGSSYDITKGSGYEQYSCTVSDGKQTDDYDFSLNTEDVLTVTQRIKGEEYYPETETDYYFASEGEKLTLSVDAKPSKKDATLSYTWYDTDYGKLLDVTGSSYDITKGSGYEQYRCIVREGEEMVVCDFLLNEIDNCDHVSDAGTITKAATETTTGIKTYKCTVCGTVLKEETIPATGTTDPTTPEQPKGDTGEDTTTQTKDNTGAATTAQSKTNTAKANTAKAAAATVLKNGTQVTDQKTKAVLKVTSKNTVTYVKSSNKKAASVTIPTSITKNGTKYTVTAIAPKAFYKNKKLKKVVIPKTVKKIGKQAFFGCKNLKKITIKTTSLKKKSVGAKAFKGIHKKATIKVPKKQKKAYKKILKARGIAKTVKVK